MALRWLEGWDASTNLTHLGRIYESVAGTITQADGANTDAIGRAVSSSDLVVTSKAVVGATTNSWIIGLAFRPNNLTLVNNPSVPYFALANVDGEQVKIEFVQANPASSKPGGNQYKIRVSRGATELASSTQRFGINTDDERWVFFEFKVTIHDSTGSFEGRYQYMRKPSRNAGGTLALAWDAANTGLDTQNQTSTGADRFVLSLATGNAATQVAVDELYLCDNSGAKNNDYLGKVIIEVQKPAGDGSTVAWVLTDATSTQDAWDEAITAIDDDGRVVSETPTDVHLATVDPLVYMLGANTTIVGIRHDIIARMETAGSLEVAHMFRKTTGTPAETNSGSIVVADTTYEGSSVVLEDDPNTATDFDIADLNSYQYGVRNEG